MNKSDLEDPIFYSARDSIYTDLKNKQVHLFGEASVDNGQINMTAGYILIDLDANEITATYAYDADSNEVEFPQFTDGADVIDANTIRYNFDTKKGYIEEVAIQQDENFLYMGVAKVQPNKHVHFRKGRFTTCNLKEPHYHFQLSKAVLVPEKRIATGPMNLWISGVPTPIGLPFSIIPQSEERTKGLLFPQFVPTSQYGFGFQDLGYYLPINDYLQMSFYGTLYSRGSWGLRNQTDYNKLYKWRGNFNLGFQQFRSGFPTNSSANKLTVGWNHTKDAKSSPYWGFNARVNFISDNNSQNNLDPINPTYFNNTFTSDINLTRTFPSKPISAGAKLSLRQNSVTQNISLTSPVVNVNVTRFFPFKKLVKGTRGFRAAIARFGMTYSFEGQNRATFGDSLIQQRDYSTLGDQFFNGIDQRVTAQTTIGMFKNTWKLSPSVQYGNKINFQQTSRTYSASDSLIRDTLGSAGLLNGMSHSLSANAQLTTVVYTYYKFIGKKQPLLRHVLTPSFTFSYRPNLNPIDTALYEDGTNYLVNGDPLLYSRFENSLYSIGQTNDQALLSFGFNNTFELKRKSDKDTLTGFKKTRIIDAFSITGNYDFLKDTAGLSNIGMNLRISPAKWVNFVGTASFSPYSWIDSSGATTGYYAIGADGNGKLGRFMNVSLATTFTFTSKEGRKELENSVTDIARNWNADFEYFLLHPEYVINFNIPWKVSLSHVYGLTRNTNKSTDNPDLYANIQTLMVNGDVSITKRWKLATIMNLDLKELDITNARYTLTRDMHCWALSFTWTPIGGNKSFLFSIRNTSSLFQDAKIDIRKPPAFL